MKILGISAFYHDSAAALIDDGKIIAAAQEERFTRKKFDPCFPAHAIQYCLRQAGCALSAVDYVAFYEKPLRKFERLLKTYAAFAPKGFQSFRHAVPLWLEGKLFQKTAIRKALKQIAPTAHLNNSLLFAEHHQSHAASAFFPSPFEEAVVLTMDGVGEWATTSVALGSRNTLKVDKEIRFPHSLGLLYAAVTQYLGFKVLSGEYKVMGLAPYGSPKYRNLFLERLIDVKADGTFHLDQTYFGYCAGQSMITEKFSDLFGRPARRPDRDVLDQFHMDVAASVQAVTEEVITRICHDLAAKYNTRNLCLAGGVALNCVANARILREGAFENIWIQPAAGDAGCALGAALAAWYQHLENARTPDARHDGMHGTYLGPAYSQAEIESRLTNAGAAFDVLDDDAVFDSTVLALLKQDAVGWFQGRMEFGPRALGARSILADARSPTMQSMLNIKVKDRENFRPFAPSVLREDVAEWF
jgi:carbamoyltransferase